MEIEREKEEAAEEMDNYAWATHLAIPVELLGVLSLIDAPGSRHRSTSRDMALLYLVVG